MSRRSIQTIQIILLLSCHQHRRAVGVKDAPFDIWGGGGGARQKLKKIVCRHKSQKKKFVENVGRKKSLYVDQKKHQIGLC